MKKFICIILACLLLPIASLALVGCDNKSYKLETFCTTYESIVKDTPYLTLIDASNPYNMEVTSKKIGINYESMPALQKATNSSKQYNYINSLYQQLLDDSLAPVFFFGNKIAVSDRLSKEQIKLLFENLEVLSIEYNELDYYLGILNNSLTATTDSTINLSHLKKVFLQYEKLITAAGNLSTVVSTIYFNTILSMSDFDYSTKKIEDITTADLVKISIETRAKMYYFKSVYANIYHQMFIKNSNIANLITSNANVNIEGYLPHTYMASVKTLSNKSYDALITSPSIVESIYKNSISLYNIQSNFESAYTEFNLATSMISYANLNEKSSNEEKAYGKIIERFAYGIAFDSYEVLENLASTLYNY